MQCNCPLNKKKSLIAQCAAASVRPACARWAYDSCCWTYKPILTLSIILLLLIIYHNVSDRVCRDEKWANRMVTLVIQPCLAPTFSKGATMHVIFGSCHRCFFELRCAFRRGHVKCIAKKIQLAIVLLPQLFQPLFWGFRVEHCERGVDAKNHEATLILQCAKIWYECEILTATLLWMASTSSMRFQWYLI